MAGHRNRILFLSVTISLVAALLVANGAAAQSTAAAASAKPKVRAITAFIRLDTATYEQQIADTLTMLRAAKAAFEKGGYEVQTIRISTQPFTEYTVGWDDESTLAFFHQYDNLAKKENFDADIGPAMTADSDDPAQVQRLARILSNTSILNASVVIAGQDGVHWHAVHAAAGAMKYLEDHTGHSLGNFRFAAIANVPQYTPFFPASYHDGIGHQFAIALESANVIAAVMATPRDPQATRQAIVAELGMHARAIEDIASKVDLDTGWSYMGIDLSPAPLKDVSIAAAIEGSLGGAKFGSPGTLTAAATITSALRDIQVRTVGYSGLMMPVLEDSRMSERWTEGSLSMDQLLAYSAVCGTGLDVIPLPGDITEQQLERIVGDVASLSAKWSKPLSARLLPVAGAKPGDKTTFEDPFLVNAVIRPMP